MKPNEPIFAKLENDTCLTLNNLFAMSIAECGAQGENGRVAVYSIEDHQVFVRSTNFCYDNYDMDKLAELFAPVPILTFELPKDTAGWRWAYMGGGNHLWVRDEIYPELAYAVKHPPGVLSTIITMLQLPPIRWYWWHDDRLIELLQKKAAE